MKELIYEYGALALSAIPGSFAFVIVITAFLSEDGAFAALMTRCMSYWF